MLSEITTDDVERYIEHRRQQTTRRGSPPANATVNRELENLKTLFYHAQRTWRLEHNPMRGFRLLREDNVRDRVLSPLEFLHLVAECPPHVAPIVQLAYRTGMRLGEILGLKRGQVDIQARIIRLGSADTKNAEARLVPLDEDMAGLLEDLPRSLLTDHVFHRRGRAIRDIRGAFSSACLRAGITDFRFHDLRHCAVTNMARLGESEKVIMEITGHKTTYMLRRYQKVDNTDLQTAAARVQRLLRESGEKILPLDASG